MRDLSAAEKSEYHNLEKQYEKKTKELNEMTQKKEKLQVELEIVSLCEYILYESLLLHLIQIRGCFNSEQDKIDGDSLC